MSRSFRPATEKPPVKVLPTGIANLDFATGIGGIPLGTQVEIYGRASVGKSLLAYYLIAEAQRRGHKCAYIDLEGTFDPAWAQDTSKLSLKDLDLAEPDPGSDAVNTLEEAVSSGEYKIVVFDSLGSMVDDGEKEFTTMRVGGTARIIKNMTMKINPIIKKNEVIILYINHAAVNMSAAPGPGALVEQAPGGKGKEHMMSMRLYLKPGETLMHKGERKGFRVNGKLIKNKRGAPHKTAGWNVWNEPDPVNGVLGIDLIQDIIDTSINHGIITRGGAWYSHPVFGEKAIQGENGVFKFISENPGAIDVLRQDVLDLASLNYSKEKRFDE